MSEASKQVATTCAHHSKPTISQCASLSTIRKPILESCHRAQDISVDDFESVLEEESLNTSAVEDESQYDLTNTLDFSVVSSEEEESCESSSNNRPFVPFSVEELSLVRSLNLWTNPNVRVFGTISPGSFKNTNLWSLQSVGEEGGPFSLHVDMQLIEKFPLINTQVQIFGEIIVNNSKPSIRAKLIRDFSTVDGHFYRTTIEEWKKYIPHFMKISVPT